jgi:hypothetical protein
MKKVKTPLEKLKYLNSLSIIMGLYEPGTVTRDEYLQALEILEEKEIKKK